MEFSKDTRRAWEVVKATQLNAKCTIEYEPGWYTFNFGDTEDIHVPVRDEIIDKWPIEKAAQYIIDVLF